MSNKQTLTVKYRPAIWQDLTEQEYIKSILENQIKINSVKNAYLFTHSCLMSARQHQQEYLEIK